MNSAFVNIINQKYSMKSTQIHKLHRTIENKIKNIKEYTCAFRTLSVFYAKKLDL